MTESLADGALPRPEASGHCVVNNDDAGTIGRVGGGEIAAFDQLHSERVKVAGGHAIDGQYRPFTRRRRRLAFDNKSSPDWKSPQRQAPRKRGALDARQCREPCLQPLVMAAA